MSADTRLDERLRESFGADDGWAPQVSLRDVRAQARRTTTRRRLALAAAVAAIVAGGAGLAVTLGGAGDRAEPVAPLPGPTSLTPAFEGTWMTPPLDERRVRRELSEAGFDRATADAVVEELGFEDFNRVHVRLVGGFLDTTVQHSDMADDELLDRQRYRIEGDLLVLTPREADGVTVLRVTRTGERLRLELVSSTEPDQRGIPAEAYVVALYTSVWFTPDG